jgi:hypothetical protein
MAKEDTVPTREEINDVLKKLTHPPGQSKKQRNDRRVNAIRNMLQAKNVAPKDLDAIISDLPSYTPWESDPPEKPREV